MQISAVQDSARLQLLQETQDELLCAACGEFRPCGSLPTAIALHRHLPPFALVYTAAWPLPPEFQPFYGYWLQGPRKRYMLPQPDESIDQLVKVLDKPPVHGQQQQQQDGP